MTMLVLEKTAGDVINATLNAPEPEHFYIVGVKSLILTGFAVSTSIQVDVMTKCRQPGDVILCGTACPCKGIWNKSFDQSLKGTSKNGLFARLLRADTFYDTH